MASKAPNPPPDSIFNIDLNPCKPFLVDLPPGAMRGMRSEQDGWLAVRGEVLGNQAKLGDRAGITATDFNRFVALDDQVKQVTAQLPRVEKAVEVVRETLAHIDNQRHKLATRFADSAESHSSAEGGDPTLLTAYEKTIAYRSVIAAKAVKTRQKNSEPQAGAPQGGGDAGAGAPPDPAAPAEGAGKAAQAVSRIPGPPPDDVFSIDLTPLQPFLVDLPPGATRGMRKEQDGWEGVVQEIAGNQGSYGDRAGITTTDFNRFVALNEQYAQVAPVLPLLEKAEEILTESLAHLDNQRHKLVTQFAAAAESHASAEGGDPTLLTAYEKTIAYRSVIADKAAKTRKKNEEARKASPAAGGAVPPPGGDGAGNG